MFQGRRSLWSRGADSSRYLVRADLASPSRGDLRMIKRRRVSTRERVALFQREAGRCHHCLGLVYPGQAWQLSHKIPLALGGADDEKNWGVIHRRPCHEELTRNVDIPSIAQAKRREARHIGAKQSSGLIRSRGLPLAAPKDRTLTKRSNGVNELARRFAATED